MNASLNETFFFFHSHFFFLSLSLFLLVLYTDAAHQSLCYTHAHKRRLALWGHLKRSSRKESLKTPLRASQSPPSGIGIGMIMMSVCFAIARGSNGSGHVALYRGQVLVVVIPPPLQLTPSRIYDDPSQTRSGIIRLGVGTCGEDLRGYLY